MPGYENGGCDFRQRAAFTTRLSISSMHSGDMTFQDLLGSLEPRPSGYYFSTRDCGELIRAGAKGKGFCLMALGLLELRVEPNVGLMQCNIRLTSMLFLF